jgi:DNA-binding response OmpR family regulator
MNKHSVLIIEDDPKLNEIMSLTLRSDFEIETVTDGRDGLNRLKEFTPHIVVLDLNLPGVPGREILTAIRSQERFAKTRVILTTADERQAETMTEEVDIVLLKPVSPVQLRELALRLRSM